MTAFLNKISSYIKARIPIVYVVTWEEELMIESLKTLVNSSTYIKDNRDILTWSITQGLKNDIKTIDGNLDDTVKILNYIDKYNGDAIFVLKDIYADLARAVNKNAGNQFLLRKMKDLVYSLKNSRYRKTIIIVAYDKFIPDDLQKDILIEEYSLPDEKKLLDILTKLVKDNQGNSNLYFEENKQIISRLCNAALGLTSAEAENAFALALVKDGRIDEDDIEFITNEKKQIIKQSGVLEFSNTRLNMADVGGLENLKEWLEKRDDSWSEEARSYNLPNPKGLLITGVPGCGKSLTAKSVSSMWNLPLLRLDIGSLFEGLVGSSERNMRNAISTAEAVAPCVLWIDEIEKAFAGQGSSGDSGTSTRLFGTFLTWMQDKQSFVFVIATANKIDTLPPELMRKGRFDEIFFVDLPAESERREILRIHLNKRLNDINSVPELKSDEFLQEMIRRTESFTGSEIEQLIIAALFEAYSGKRKATYQDFYDAVTNTVPLYVTQKREIEGLREWAKTRAVSASLNNTTKAKINQIEKDQSRTLEL